MSFFRCCQVDPLDICDAALATMLSWVKTISKYEKLSKQKWWKSSRVHWRGDIENVFVWCVDPNVVFMSRNLNHIWIIETQKIVIEINMWSSFIVCVIKILISMSSNLKNHQAQNWKKHSCMKPKLNCVPSASCVLPFAGFHPFIYAEKINSHKNSMRVLSAIAFIIN